MCIRFSSQTFKIYLCKFRDRCPWRYSSEEPRSTEVVAARWHYRGLCGQQSAYPSNLISVFLTGFHYFSSSYSFVLTRLGGPRSRPYTSKKISRVQLGIEPWTSWMAVRCANHYTKQVVQIIYNRLIWLCLTTAWHVLRLHAGETASRYGGQLRICCQSTRGGLPAWGLTIKISFLKMVKRWNGWRMSFTYVTAHFTTLPSLCLRFRERDLQGGRDIDGRIILKQI